jgi:hypothetical protein
LIDTLLKKTGKKIAGAAWRRDPLGPPFHTNFVWAQRFVQISLAIPQGKSFCQSRSIPVDFHHCPSVKKPKPKANAEELKIFLEQKRLLRMSRQGVLRIQHLRNKLNVLPAQGHNKYFLGQNGTPQKWTKDLLVVKLLISFDVHTGLKNNI